MPSRSSRISFNDLEPKRRNPISLGDDSNIDNDLKVIKVDKKNSILELSNNELKVRGTIDASAITVDGASVQTGTDAGATQLNELSDVTYSSGDLTISSLDKIITSGNLTFEIGGDIDFEVEGDSVYFQNDSGGSKVLFDWSTEAAPYIQLLSAAGAFESTYLKIDIDGNGDTTFSTKDGNPATTASKIYFNPESYVGIDGSDLMLDATQKLYFDANNPGGAIGNTYIQESGADVLDFYVGGVNILKLTEAGGGASDKVSVLAATPIYFDGGTHTYIYEISNDVLRIAVGGDTIMQLSEKGDDGNEVHFGSSCAGFTQLEPTYDAGTTVVDFRHSNKQNLTFGAGNITHLALYFPLVSGNFQLLIKQDGTGSRTITGAYKVFEFDETAADGFAEAVFAGGSNPTLTTDANHVDILSFYWDADNEIAYGVASLDFQF